MAVPLRTYAANLVLIINFMKAQGILNIIVLAPPPVDDSRVFPGLRNNRTRVYAEAAKKAAAQAGVPSLDLWRDLQASV